MDERGNESRIETNVTQGWQAAQSIKRWTVIAVTSTALFSAQVARGQCSQGQCSLYVNNDLSANCCQPPGCPGTDDDPYCDIEDAIAASVSGQTVCVLPGTYAPPIQTPPYAIISFGGKRIRLESTGGRDNTTIMASVEIPGSQGSETVLKGFTITNTVYPNRAAVICSSTSPDIRSNKIIGSLGRGIRLIGSNSLVIDNIITGNGGRGIYTQGASPLITDNLITANEGGGVHLVDSAATLRGNVISGHQLVSAVGAGIRISSADRTFDVKIVDCLIEDNQVTFGHGGGLHARTQGTVSMVNCIVRNNSVFGTDRFGGGIYVAGITGVAGGALDPCNPAPPLTLVMQNCLVTCNHAADRGGGVYADASAKADIINCTFTGNTAGEKGGGIAAAQSCVGVHNSILWGDSAPAGPELAALANSDVTVSHSILQGGCDAIHLHNPFGVTCAGQANVLDEDPLFVDPLGLDGEPCSGDEDLRLSDSSPGIDAGDNNRVLPDFADLDNDMITNEPTPCDLDYCARFVDDPNTPPTGVCSVECPDVIVDMGPYEFQEPCTPCGGGECFPSSTPGTPTVVEEVTLSAGQNTATTGASIKNRFISVTCGDPGRNQALRVKVISLPAPYDVWNGMDLWVSQLLEVCENAGSAGVAPCAAPAPGLAKNTFWAARLSCDWNDALFMDWTTLDLPVHIYNEVIIPSNRAQGKDQDAVYEVAFVDDSCSLKDDNSYSDPLTIIQPRWGDVLGACNKNPCSAPQGVVNIGDVDGILAKFQNLPGSPIKSRADLVGLPGNEGELDRIISIVDVTWCLDAFIGGKYGFAPGDPCDGR